MPDHRLSDPSLTAQGAPRFRRVLVKLSGEALAAPDGYWLHPPTLAALADDIAGRWRRASRSPSWSAAAT